jgi:hypothetical protein
MKHFFSSLLLLLTCSIASAQFSDYPKIAIAALAGDELVLSRYRLSSSGSLSYRAIERYDLTGLGFNAGLARAMEHEVRTACPRCERSLLGLTPELKRTQTAVVNGSVAVDRLIVPFMSAAEENNYSYLIIVTRHRALMRTPTLNERAKVGLVDGLGFYLDPDATVQDAATGNLKKGFLSAFAYLRLILVDVKTQQLVGERRSTLTRVFTNNKGTNRVEDLWASLSDEEKAKTLEALAEQAIEVQLPGLLSFLLKKR